mgnify:FL=1
MGPFQIILLLLILILPILGNWYLYQKAGKPGWAAIIPIYATIVWLEVIGKPWYWLLLFLIPYVNIIFLIWALNLTSKSFGKGVGFTIGLILLPGIFLPILGLGSSKYIGPAGK